MNAAPDRSLLKILVGFEAYGARFIDVQLDQRTNFLIIGRKKERNFALYSQGPMRHGLSFQSP